MFSSSQAAFRRDAIPLENMKNGYSFTVSQNVSVFLFCSYFCMLLCLACLAIQNSNTFTGKAKHNN